MFIIRIIFLIYMLLVLFSFYLLFLSKKVLQKQNPNKAIKLILAVIVINLPNFIYWFVFAKKLSDYSGQFEGRAFVMACAGFLSLYAILIAYMLKKSLMLKSKLNLKKELKEELRNEKIGKKMSNM